MSLNWKEINLILKELDLPGSQIQGAVQSTFDVIGLRLYQKGSSSKGGSSYKEGAARLFLIALTPGACRMHETFRPFPKTEKPLRFAQFLNSRIVNGWIEEAMQLGENRIVRLKVRRGENRFLLYIRLWSNAANFIVTDENGTVLDAMRRLPKKGEISGGRYIPEESPCGRNSKYVIRELAGDISFNKKIDTFYAEHGGALSLETLREQAQRKFEGSICRITAALEKLRAKAQEFVTADSLREYGDIILANAATVKPGEEWLETENFFQSESAEVIRIKLDPRKTPASQAEYYYEQYRKAKNGLAEIQAEIEAGERELLEVEERLARLLCEENPLVLAKLLKTGSRPGGRSPAGRTTEQDKKRPGLSFRRGEWQIIIGRDAAENDAILRRHVKGGDLWLHARDFPGSYVFIKQRPGKTFPLEILLDAGNLAVFYSKGRNNGEADLFYTPVKYLRRAKNRPKGSGSKSPGPTGLVIPTQEKNLHIKVDTNRLRELEACRVQ